MYLKTLSCLIVSAEHFFSNIVALVNTESVISYNNIISSLHLTAFQGESTIYVTCELLLVYSKYVMSSQYLQILSLRKKLLSSQLE